MINRRKDTKIPQHRTFAQSCGMRLQSIFGEFRLLCVVDDIKVFVFLRHKCILMDRKEIVNKAEQAIRAVEPDAEIILFGSEARGDARPGSDIDLLVLLSGDKLSFDRESVICGDLLLLEGQTGISISPKIYLKKNWENRPILTPFYMNVMQEGIGL